jgi:hypothetical protein
MCYLETKVTIRKERILIDKEIPFTRLIHPFPFPFPFPISLSVSSTSLSCISFCLCTSAFTLSHLALYRRRVSPVPRDSRQ